MTKTFKNKNFTKRDYECTNVVFYQAEKAPAAYWIECSEAELMKALNRGMTQLWIQAGVKFFGWL